MYIFGYGSLIWKADFPFADKQPGFIKGYVRRFWQSSSDNRGTPETPGRVVTLIPSHIYHTQFAKIDPHYLPSDGAGEDVIHGMLYRIADENVEKVKAQLDYREKDGYTTETVQVFVNSSQETHSSIDALLYIATTSNTSFVGPQPLDVLANIIFSCQGESGKNSEYLLKLCDAHSELCGSKNIDHHLDDLKRRVLFLEQQNRHLPN